MYSIEFNRRFVVYSSPIHVYVTFLRIRRGSVNAAGLVEGCASWKLPKESGKRAENEITVLRKTFSADPRLINPCRVIAISRSEREFEGVLHRRCTSIPNGLHAPPPVRARICLLRHSSFTLRSASPVSDVWLNGFLHKTRHDVPLNVPIPTAFNKLRKINTRG